MKNRTAFFVMILVMLLWAGMVAGISFLEAWLKFQAPYVTLPIGLGIGKLVFGYLNKIEIIWCAAILICTIYSQHSVTTWRMILVTTTILLVQTFWLLPALDVRADAIIAGENVPASMLHFYYVILEFVKFGLLVINARLVFGQAVSSSKEVYSVQHS